MKKLIIVSLVLLFPVLRGQLRAQQSESMQKQMRIGAGYFGQNLVHPGLVLEFEYERTGSQVFSLPLKASLAYHSQEEYHAILVDIQKGFRKSFTSGFFLEQGIGAGMVIKSYQTEFYYIDEYMNSIPHGGKPVAGFMPSVNFGAGFDLSRNKEGSSLLWIRPKIYWDLGFRKLHQPYFALQVGYSRTIKTR